MATRKNIERARRGAAWLDKKIGRRRKLDMQYGYVGSPADCGCILAEGLAVPDTSKFGFDAESWDALDWNNDLREAWLEVLREGDRV